MSQAELKTRLTNINEQFNSHHRVDHIGHHLYQVLFMNYLIHKAVDELSDTAIPVTDDMWD